MDWNAIFGSGQDLNPLQMAVRAVVMFFITLALIRFGGVRIFGKKTAVDNIIVIMLGAVLARGVVGASPFLSTVAAGTVMVVLHRVLALLATRFVWVGMIVKGIHRTLYSHGKMDERTMRRVAISKDDLLESVRVQINERTLDNVDEIKIEKNGQVSVIKKPKATS
jgi:uncharacterized membrane protein YcaP (DUF421 family)